MKTKVLEKTPLTEIHRPMKKTLYRTYYKNPISAGDFPDPSIIAVRDKGYYAYATHDEFSPTINNILCSHSWDLTHWSDPVGALIAPPSWAKTCERFWAPHVAFAGGEYRMYYAAEPDTRNGMCLAMAVSDSPCNFEDIGRPLAQIAGSTYQMIDPCFFADPVTGRHYLYYGSAHEPIRVAALAADGRSFISAPVEVLWPDADLPLEQLREGAYVTYNEEYKRYFLWVSGNNTWEERSYAVSVYWSDDPLKPFTKVPGEHQLLRPNKAWDCPGQNCIITDALGIEWMVYHAVDSNERYIKGTDKFMRKMCMDRVMYNAGGWPYIETYSPSSEPKAGPVISIPVSLDPSSITGARERVIYE
jgi:arabinan endo-1,5-alpha-L-arabinosidase